MQDLTTSFETLKKLPIAKTIEVKKHTDLNKLKLPFFIKASISGHKTEEKAIFKCNTIEEAKKNFDFLSKKFKGNKIVIQEQVEGIEMFIGIKSDPIFEKLLLIGFGGTQIEVIKDIEFRALPLTKSEIKKAIEDLKLYPSLYKRKKYAIDKLVDLAFEVSKMDINELDLNPVILTEEKAVIVDARLS